jgi:hypothetical protein
MSEAVHRGAVILRRERSELRRMNGRHPSRSAFGGHLRVTAKNQGLWLCRSALAKDKELGAKAA